MCTKGLSTMASVKFIRPLPAADRCGFDILDLVPTSQVVYIVLFIFIGNRNDVKTKAEQH